MCFLLLEFYVTIAWENSIQIIGEIPSISLSEIPTAVYIFKIISPFVCRHPTPKFCPHYVFSSTVFTTRYWCIF
jgi:hypothetical protein